MNPIALVVTVARLATRVLELVPEPDPELRAQRVRHRQEMAATRERHHHERAMARIARRRRG